MISFFRWGWVVGLLLNEQSVNCGGTLYTVQGVSKTAVVFHQLLAFFPFLDVRITWSFISFLHISLHAFSNLVARYFISFALIDLLTVFDNMLQGISSEIIGEGVK